MNLLQLTNKIKEAADLHPLVNQVADGSIYEALNTGDVRYPISVVFSQSVVKEVRTIRYKYVLYFVDRLVGDNALEIQTTAISVIQQIINTLGNNVENISIVDGYSIQPFTEKFADECAGAFVQFDIVAENVLGNCSYDEGGDQPILDSYVRKDEVKQSVIEGETLPISSGAVFTALQGISVDVDAVDVSYDNTTSGIISNNVQGAIDELKVAIDTPLSVRHDQTRDKNGNPLFLHATQAQHDRWTNNYSYKIEDTSVSSWSASNKYADFGYQAQINIENLTENDIVSVVFSGADVINGNYYPTIEIYEGYILVFSKVNATITIPTIEITKIDL